ncbi:MAG: CinA family protein [Anaerolineae bacterium]|nr:MAG: CinA family protein [Anaerolineae bacterium]
MTAPLEVRLGDLLRARSLTLAVAESCTGGLLGDRITNVAGSSDYFLGGVIAYANRVKEEVLGVPAETLEREGAVSRETVLAMARGVRRLLGADVALSVSGIAGPGGGTPEKPVGTTWIALSAPEGAWARRFRWQGDRLENKALSAEAALRLLLSYLEGDVG